MGRMGSSTSGEWANVRKHISSLVLAVILVTACQASPPPTPVPAATAAGADPFGAVRAHIERLVADGEIPSMAVAVARDGEITWEEGFGLANRENNSPATEHTAYALASISKPLTATGLMVLVEQGLIDLDVPIDDYLGEAKLQARVVDAAGATVRRVASHTAGLPLHSQHFYDDEAHRPPPMDETVHRYANLVTAPGERYQYSNLGYGLLGYVVSRVSGQGADRLYPYADFMREEVFAPLGMGHTSVHVGPGLEEGQAVKYTPKGAVVPPCDSDSPGASAIYSSAHDLIRFAIFHLKNDLPDQRAVITGSTIDEMQRPNPETGPMKEWEREGSGYGIGWYIGVTENGLRVVHHSGGTVGVSTVLALMPEENLAVAVLSNTHSQWPDAILIEILCALLSLQPEEFLPPAGGLATEPPFAPDPGLIGSWEGLVHTYEGELSLVLEIGECGGVYATLGEQPRTLLQSVSYQDSLPQFLNAGGGPFLRGWMQGELETADVNRGRPTKLWLELKLRENVLDGSLIAFSQREFYTGPLAHWVALRKVTVAPGGVLRYTDLGPETKGGHTWTSENTTAWRGTIRSTLATNGPSRSVTK
jgi:CubicO group peptidase (beta-lactamase class C family)